MGVWQRLRRCQTPNLSPLRMLTVNLPTLVKCTRYEWALDIERMFL